MHVENMAIIEGFSSILRVFTEGRRNQHPVFMVARCLPGGFKVSKSPNVFEETDRSRGGAMGSRNSFCLIFDRAKIGLWHPQPRYGHYQPLLHEN